MHIPPNWGIFFTLIVSFLVFWFIFKRLFFDPFLKVIEQRERRLKELGERAEQLVKEGQAADAERERQLGSLRRELLAERDSSRRSAEEEAARLIEQAKSDARASLERAGSAIEQEIRAAEQRLKEYGESLASDLAERILGRRLSNGARTNRNT